MKSKTKTRLSETQILELVRKHFGQKVSPTAITELKGGMFNAAYRLDRIGDHQAVVLKVSVGPDKPILTYERNIMAAELEVYRLLRERSSVPIPAILVQDLSRQIIDRDYFFMTALQGETMHKMQRKLTADENNALKAEVAGYMAQIHNIHNDYFGYLAAAPDEHFSNWRQAWQHMMGMIIQDGHKRQVRLPYERIEKVLERHLSLLDHIQTPSLVDYDLWAGNIFITKVNDRFQVEGIVDFERSFWGDPLADYASSIIMLSDIRKEPIYWNSYKEARGGLPEIGDDDITRINLYKLYLWTIMVVETYRYDFPYRQFQHSFSLSLLKKTLTDLEQV